MKRIFQALILCPLLAAAGCATYSKEECSSGNWSAIGEQDGRDGRTPDKFDLHVKACKLDRSAASRTLYLEGREKGLQSYCTDIRGYREGSLGQQYLNTCPQALESQFLKGYSLGRKIYQVESRQSDVADALRAASNPQEEQRLEAENARLKSEIEKLRAEGDALVLASRRKDKT